MKQAPADGPGLAWFVGAPPSPSVTCTTSGRAPSARRCPPTRRRRRTRPPPGRSGPRSRSAGPPRTSGTTRRATPWPGTGTHVRTERGSSPPPERADSACHPWSDLGNRSAVGHVVGHATAR
ncbi:hypothetical protein CIB93_17660 [Streptomyces sp. WZ.A104]|nr:hypothetical protein CIB93_17660 [Streptomyces sp. WZ.A104]